MGWVWQKQGANRKNLKHQASEVLGTRRGGRGKDRILEMGDERFLSSSYCKIFASKEESQGMGRKPEERVW